MILPLGTKLSIHNGQLLTSTGVPSLDEVLGGGLPVRAEMKERARACVYARRV